MTNAFARQDRLLTLLRLYARPITTSDVRLINTGLGSPKKTTARSDIADLQRRGLLAAAGTDGQRSYRLTRKATA
ncbi:hypothetical protein [Streptomyces sp. NPDC059916]|uniref:hypothetical protein n=1 Tax=Streptomyces sp. NPDC059916 TaxID=3347001 RepID=UPI0036A06C3E